MNRQEYNKQYHQDNLEVEHQRCKDYYKTNKGKVLTKQLEYRKKNKSIYNKKRKEYYYNSDKKSLSQYQKLRIKVLDRLGNKCVRCGFSDGRALQVDHIKNNGYVEFKKYTARQIYQRVLKLPPEELKKNYQLLCANCNWIKKYETKEKKWFGDSE